MKNTYEFIVKVEVSGEITQDEVKDFIQFELGTGSISNDNPLINEEMDTEITNVDIVDY